MIEEVRINYYIDLYKRNVGEEEKLSGSFLFGFHELFKTIIFMLWYADCDKIHEFNFVWVA